MSRALSPSRRDVLSVNFLPPNALQWGEKCWYGSCSAPLRTCLFRWLVPNISEEFEASVFDISLRGSNAFLWSYKETRCLNQLARLNYRDLHGTSARCTVEAVVTSLEITELRWITLNNAEIVVKVNRQISAQTGVEMLATYSWQMWIRKLHSRVHTRNWESPIPQDAKQEPN